MNGKRGTGALEEFPLPADVTFKPLASTKAESGAGSLVELTDSRVVFATESPLSIGSRLEVSIRWPAPAGIPPTLRLIFHGTVLRLEDGKAVVEIQKYGG